MLHELVLAYGVDEKKQTIKKKVSFIPACDLERSNLFGCDPAFGVKKNVYITVNEKYKCVIDCGRRIPLTIFNTSLFENEDQKHQTCWNNLYHFYHLWVGGNSSVWPLVLNEHLDALICSGLLFALKTFFIGFVGHKEQIAIAKDLLQKRNIKYEIAVCTDDGFEQETQKYMFTFVSNFQQQQMNKQKKEEEIGNNSFDRKQNNHILYCHNKGSFNIGQEFWRRSMTFYNVFEWQECVQALNTDKYDVVGIHWLKPEVYGSIISTPFFGGNFWWSTFHHIERSGFPNTNSRYDAEAWIGQCPNTRALDRKQNSGWPTYHSPDPNT